MLAHAVREERTGLERQIAAAKLRLTREIGRVLCCLAPDTADLNQAFYEQQEREIALADRLRRAQMLIGYPDWPPSLVAELRREIASLTIAQRRSILTGSPLAWMLPVILVAAVWLVRPGGLLRQGGTGLATRDAGVLRAALLAVGLSLVIGAVVRGKLGTLFAALVGAACRSRGVRAFLNRPRAWWTRMLVVLSCALVVGLAATV